LLKRNKDPRPERGEGRPEDTQMFLNETLTNDKKNEGLPKKEPGKKKVF